MIHLNIFAKSRHSMLLIPLAIHLMVSLPIFGFIAYALWTADFGRLFLGGFVLAGYCGAAWVLVKMVIAIDEQYLRHLRLKPDVNGNYEQPLENEQAQSPFDVDLRAAVTLPYTEQGIPMTSAPYQGYRGTQPT